jgi:hypothetical protein
MALFSKHHNAAVQPRLNRIRKRIVLDLDAYEWRDEDNDKNIQYAVCLISGESSVLTCAYGIVSTK